MSRERLAFALKHLKSSDWARFEDLAAQFLASEISNYRNMAATYGDKGRDGEIFCEGDNPKVLFQISVAEDWESKINKTVARLRENFKKISKLVYVTNRQIGPAADGLKRDLLKSQKIVLDIYDHSWFVDRESTNVQRQIASGVIARAIVEPILMSENVTKLVSQGVTDQENRIALLHLALDANDRELKKGLTKSCYESLVVAALHDTNPDNRLKADDIADRVKAMLPAGFEERAAIYVATALSRLSKKRGRVKHWRTTDDYCLSADELDALHQSITVFIAEEQVIEDELTACVCRSIGRLRNDIPKARQAAQQLKGLLEESLLVRGEAFASAVAGQLDNKVDDEDFKRLLREKKPSAIRSGEHAAAVDAVCSFLESNSSATRSHLRRLADAYTLFAFLRQTPDVQSALVHVFADGEIWLDTTVLLPLMAETLSDEDGEGKYTRLLAAATYAGLRLYVTDGVLEELDSHLNHAVTCSRMVTSSWRSRIPYIYEQYVGSGRDRSSFESWVDTFRGKLRPVEDMADYLKEDYSIRVKNLLDQLERAPVEVRVAAENYWNSVHDRRRQSTAYGHVDPVTLSKLVRHDVECSLGVLLLRNSTTDSSFGYRQWWLCLDRAALGFMDTLRAEAGEWAGNMMSPNLSPDFLTEYLRLGPVRNAIDRGLRVKIPALTELARRKTLSVELIEIADRVRMDSLGLPERVIRRKVRDALDEARVRMGVATDVALSDVDAELAQLNAKE